MRQLLEVTAAAFLLLLCGSAFAAESKSDAVLESITYEKDANNAEKIVFKLNGAHIPKVFKIKGERPRLVFDFIDTRYSDLINRVIDTKGNLVEGVRVGIHNDPPKTRVVVDLKREGDFKFEQDFQVQENTLSITFHPNEPVSGEPAEQPVKRDDAPIPAPAAATQPKTDLPDGPPDPFRRPAALPAVPDTAAGGTAAPAPPTVPKEKTEAAAAAADSAAGTREQEPSKAVSAAPAAAEKPPAATATGADGKTAEELLASVAPADPILRDVSFETTADKSEMVLFKLNDFYPPIVFGIEKGNPRVVCDFLDTALGKNVRSSIETKGNYISGIRVARHQSPHKVRVVLDLVPNRNYDLQQVFFKEDNLFIIIINEFEEEPVPADTVTGNAAP